jgi:hypothetical protein
METIWRVLDGKKTTLAALAGVAIAWAQARSYVDGDTAQALALALTIMTGVAVGHKVQKAAKGK